MGGSVGCWNFQDIRIPLWFQQVQVGLNICNFKGAQGDFDMPLGLRTTSFKPGKTGLLGFVVKELK